jgi:hypothetical protein
MKLIYYVLALLLSLANAAVCRTSPFITVFGSDSAAVIGSIEGL